MATGRGSFEITIEPDGTITSKTDEIAPLDHRSADDFLKMVKRLQGGAIAETKQPHSHKHTGHQQKVGR